MTVLSPHFTLDEMIITETGARLGLDNTPDQQVIDNLQLLCTNVLEPLRNELNLPINVLSGYRSPAVNRAVGGVPDSQHVVGQAADIHISGMSVENLFQYVINQSKLPFDQVIQEFNQWVHVSYRANPRGNKQRATVENGRTVYTDLP
jgi:zinc D-Ala-D-Ala carboxypeptidase